MPKMVKLLTLLAVVIATGCATQADFLNQHQDAAIQTVLGRARFETNCPDATGMVISREVIQPAVQGPWVNGIQRAEYTVGVSGCGQRNTYVVVCPQGGEGCFAAGPGMFHNWQP